MMIPRKREVSGSTKRNVNNALDGNADVKVFGTSPTVTGFIKEDFTTHTGDDVTIFSYRVYEELNTTKKLEAMASSETLKGLNGQKIPVIDKKTVAMRLAKNQSPHQVLREYKKIIFLG